MHLVIRDDVVPYKHPGHGMWTTRCLEMLVVPSPIRAKKLREKNPTTVDDGGRSVVKVLAREGTQRKLMRLRDYQVQCYQCDCSLPLRDKIV